MIVDIFNVSFVHRPLHEHFKMVFLDFLISPNSMPSKSSMMIESIHSILSIRSIPTFYRSPAKLIRIINGNELVFHFEPRDRTNIPKRISMKVCMTLRRFNTSTYFFTLEPCTNHCQCIIIESFLI